jgi:uncharacterized protein YbjQ (UPF0145 family)
MLGVTTPTIPYKITRLIGLVKGSGVSSAVFKADEVELTKASDWAIAAMAKAAEAKGANAILGINIALTTGGGTDNAVFVIATGTAVVYDPNQPI